MPEFLTPQAQVLAWSVIVFFVLLGLLWKFAWGPIMRALEQRELGIQKRIDDAHARFEESEAKLVEYERRLDTAKDVAAEIIAEGKRDVEKLKGEILAETNQESERTLARAKREIHLAQQAALQQIRDQVTSLAAEMAERVIEREVKPDDHRRFIQNAISHIEKS
ncbi:MAG: F0F1 ATP synthase subunit B [Planctomycetota bacterium]